MITRLLIKNPDDFHTLSEIVDLLLDEKNYPTIRLIEPPLLPVHITPIIVRARLNLLVAWKKHMDHPEKPEDKIAEEILVYVALILTIATDIRNGVYTSRALLSPEADMKCRDICKQIADNMTAAGFEVVTSNQWRMGTQKIIFGDIVNVEGLRFYWRSGQSVFCMKKYLQELIKSDDMEGED